MVRTKRLVHADMLVILHFCYKMDLSCNRGFNREAWDVESLDAPGWGRRLFPLTALAVFLLHFAFLLAAASKPATPLLSNLIQIVGGLLATLAAHYASRRMRGFGKHFWLLSALSFGLWTVAQIVATYYDSIVHLPLQSPWPSDPIFILSLTPLMMTLFLHPDHGLEWKDWPRVLDLLQVVIVMLAAYLFVYAEPSHWKLSGGLLGRLAWLPDTSRDLFLVTAFSLRALLSRRRLARELYARLAIFSGVYLCCEIPYLVMQSTRNLPSGTRWDLCWSIPFVVAAILAATSNPGKDSLTPASDSEQAQTVWSQWGLVHLLPMIFPLLVLLMAAGVAEKQLTLAVAMVMASFACSSARIMFSERQRRESDIALAEKNALLQSIFEGTSDAIYVKDLQGRYLLVNDRVANFFGKPTDEIVGKTAEQLTDAATANEITKDDRRILDTGVSVTSEFRLPNKNDARSYLVTRSPYRDSRGKIIGIIGLSRDVTEHRLTEDRLRQAQKMEAIGTLAGGVAHDFNNILMVISGYSSVLNDALASDPRLRTHVEQIQKASERAAALTRQLLAFSRKQPIQPVPLNLNHIVVGMEKLLHRLIGENIIISTSLAPDVGTVLADPGQMEQVILNLAINSRDAMPQGGQLRLECRNLDIQDSAILTKNLRSGPFVELAVSDTGVGMELHVQARIFEPFFTTKPLGKGTGLGLSTVYGIVQQANGHVTFTSQPGAGTTFRVYLPRIDMPQAPRISILGKESVLDGNETVLLVEDDASVCELVRAILTSHGYSVLSARDPVDAESLCAHNSDRIHLLLSDVVMPKMSGAELSTKLVSRYPRLKVLLMSGYIDDSVVRQGLQQKEVAFLQKPFSPLSLAKKVREVLDGVRIRSGA